MNEITKRSISGILYVLIMMLGISYSEKSRIILFSIITLICSIEMFYLTKNKGIKSIFYIIYVFGIMLSLKIDYKCLLFIFILTWIFDTFAYVFGKNLGKNKMFPKISPNKTWEGFIGGLIVTSSIGIIIVNYNLIENNINIIVLYMISIILPITATLGDFIESHIKRQAKKKDSGKLIPGHGGLLDRMDAFMISIPFFYILNNII